MSYKLKILMDYKLIKILISKYQVMQYQTCLTAKTTTDY